MRVARQTSALPRNIFTKSLSAHMLMHAFGREIQERYGMRILVVIGTRPEAIKMAPVVNELRNRSGCELKVCLTGQHREMLHSVMSIFEITEDFNLDVMAANQTLFDVTSKVLLGMKEVLNTWRPDCVLVQGDTTTVMAAAMAAFYERIDVGHIEAGLRTNNRYSPFPEEINRRIASVMAHHHFAPTKTAADNLMREGIKAEQIHITGNTVIDALLLALGKIDASGELTFRMASKFEYLSPEKKLILMTGHRRENHGDGIKDICGAALKILERGDTEIVYPVHPNPNIQKPVNELLGEVEGIHLIEPLDYIEFIYLLRKSYLALTDSGGVQEEAPSLGKPVLVMRDTTERPEAITSGNALLVGTDKEEIIKQTTRLLDDEAFYASMSEAVNPYGDGKAAKRIAEVLYGEGATA